MNKIHSIVIVCQYDKVNKLKLVRICVAVLFVSEKETCEKNVCTIDIHTSKIVDGIRMRMHAFDR